MVFFGVDWVHLDRVARSNGSWAPDQYLPNGNSLRIYHGRGESLLLIFTLPRLIWHLPFVVVASRPNQLNSLK
jgi:hypothetical protein